MSALHARLRGRAAVPVILIAGGVVVCCFLVWGLMVPFLHPRATFVKVPLGPHKWLWIEFSRGRFRSAERPEQLAQAPFHPYGLDTRVPGVTSPPIHITREPAGPQGKRAPGLYLTPGWGSCDVTWEVERQGTDGATWVYAFEEVQLQPSDDVQDAPSVPTAPGDPAELTLDATLEDDDGGRTMEVTCDVSSGEFRLRTAMRDGRPVLAHVQVMDQAGKVLAAKDGELSDFEHT